MKNAFKLGLLIIGLAALTACSDDGGGGPEVKETGVSVTVRSGGVAVKDAYIFISPSNQFVISEDANFRKTVTRFMSGADGKAELISDKYSEGTHRLTVLKSGYLWPGIKETSVTLDQVSSLTFDLQANPTAFDGDVLVFDPELNYRTTDFLVREGIQFDFKLTIPTDMSGYKVMITAMDMTKHIEFATQLLANKDRILSWVNSGGLLIVGQLNDAGWSADFLPAGNNSIVMPPEDPKNDFPSATLLDGNHPLLKGVTQPELADSVWSYTEPLQVERKANVLFDAYDLTPTGVPNPNPAWKKIVTTPNINYTAANGTVIQANRYVAVADLKHGSGKILLSQMATYQASYGTVTVPAARKIRDNLVGIIKNPQPLLQY